MSVEQIREGLWKSGPEQFQADSQEEAEQIAANIARIKAERDPTISMLSNRIKLREGSFLPVLTDIGDGVETVGYGHVPEKRPWSPAQLDYLRLNQGRTFEREPMAQEEADAILESDVQENLRLAKMALPDGVFRQLSPVRRGASLGDLAHVVGGSISQFTKMAGAIGAAVNNPEFAAELFQRAGQEISNSRFGRGEAVNGVTFRGNIRRANEIGLMMQTDQLVTIQDQDPQAFVPLFQQQAQTAPPGFP